MYELLLVSYDANQYLKTYPSFPYNAYCLQKITMFWLFHYLNIDTVKYVYHVVYSILSFTVECHHFLRISTSSPMPTDRIMRQQLAFWLFHGFSFDLLKIVKVLDSFCITILALDLRVSLVVNGYSVKFLFVLGCKEKWISQKVLNDWFNSSSLSKPTGRD